MPIISPATWEQYAIVGILLVSAGAIAAAFYRLWHELLEWMEKQDLKRESERQTQRGWQEKLSLERDQQWQQFMKAMQDQWLSQDRRNTDVLEQLVKSVQDLNTSVSEHDTWARASAGEAARRSHRPG